MPGVPSEVISKGSGLVKVDAQLNTPAGRQELLQKLSELPADQDPYRGLSFYSADGV